MVRPRGGTKSPAFDRTGANLDTEEDFFASSPAANLAGANEEGHGFSRGCVACASRPLFVL